MAVPDSLVGIVVLNYNGKECLPQCLTSLQNIDYQRFFVIVVDNDSTDGSFEAAEQKFPQYSFLKLAQNRGFAAGMNVGIRAALARGAAFVWVFNNDAEAERDALSRLMAVAQTEEQAALLSPWIIEKSYKNAPVQEKLWFGKAKLVWQRMRVVHVFPNQEERQLPFYRSKCLTGCALLLRKEFLDQAGLFDERFFLYYEDTDLSLRATALGWQNLVVPGARVYHQEQSKHNPQKTYFLVLSGLQFFQKHASGLWRWYLACYVTIRRLKNYCDVMRGRDEARSVQRAYEDFYHE